MEWLFLGSLLLILGLVIVFQLLSLRRLLDGIARPRVLELYAGDGNFTRDLLTLRGDPTALELVVVDFVTTHNFYAGRFDKDNIVPPDCFAIGVDPKNMVPSPNAPNPQAKDCQSCPMNAWGSDGKGKACKNGRKLAVLPPGSGTKSVSATYLSRSA